MQLPVIGFCNVIKRAESGICVLDPQKMAPPLLRNSSNWTVVRKSEYLPPNFALGYMSCVNDLERNIL